ncbi:transposase-like protein [Staphylococcus simulans]
MNYFRYKQFNKDVITVAVGYYLRYALSYRDISEILRECGVNVHHSTVDPSVLNIDTMFSQQFRYIMINRCSE